jgi:hypothetical protein
MLSPPKPPRWYWRRWVNACPNSNARRVALWLDNDNNADRGYVDVAEYSQKFGLTEGQIIEAIRYLVDKGYCRPPADDNGFIVRRYRDAPMPPISIAKESHANVAHA